MASQLVVLAFEGESTAEGMWNNFKDMQERRLIQLEDAVIVSRGQSTEVTIKQTDSRRGKYAAAGGGIGLLAGFLVGGPIGGAAVGALLGSLRDRGIDDKFVKSLSQQLKPESSSIFLLVKSGDGQKIQEELRPFKAVVVYTTLAPEGEKRLRETLAEEE